MDKLNLISLLMEDPILDLILDQVSMADLDFFKVAQVQITVEVQSLNKDLAITLAEDLDQRKDLVVILVMEMDVKAPD